MILRTQYPNNETKKEVILSSTIIGILLYLLLIIYQPFGTNSFEHTHKNLLLFPYAIITGISFSSINLLKIKLKRNWTVGLELIKTLLILWLVSALSYLYNSIYLSKVNLSFENYLYMFGYTIALGFPVSAIYLLARYIYLNNKKQNLRTTIITDINPVIDSIDSIEKKENHFQNRINIVSDYASITLEINKEDFIFAQSADNYCIIYYLNDNILEKKIVRISLSKLLDQIQSDTIKKVHRSFIINLKKVKKFKGNSSGYKISMEKIEKELTVSRYYIDSVLPVLKNLAIHH